MEAYNWIDYIVLGIFFVSVIAGLTRGLVKEIVGLLTWVTAFVIAILFSHKLAIYFTSSDSGKALLDNASTTFGMLQGEPISLLSIAISFTCIFIVVLILGKIINYFVSSAVEGVGISFANRLLGGVFGLARGFLLVLLIMFLVNLTPLMIDPAWTQSKFVNSFQPAVAWLTNLVEPSIEDLKSTVGQTLKNVTDTFQGAGSFLRGLIR